MSTAEMSGPASDLLTFDDFCAIVRDGQKADLLDGVIYMASPDSKRCNQINGFLDRLGHVRRRPWHWWRGLCQRTAIPGFWLNIEWLMATPLPNDYQCLQELLADG